MPIKIDFFSILVVIAIAGCQIFAFAPYGFYVVNLVSIAILYILLLKNEFRFSLVLVAIYAIVVHLSVMHWISYSMKTAGGLGLLASYTIIMAMGAIQILFFMPGFALFLWLKDKVSLVERAYLFAFAFSSSEILRFFPVIGTPWVNNGYAYIDTWLIGFAPIIGGLGISFLVVFLVANAVNLAWYGTRGRVIFAICLMLTLALGYALKGQKNEVLAEKTLTAIQGNTDVKTKWTSKANSNLQNYLRITSEIKGSDAILWPESSVGFFYGDLQHLLKEYKNELGSAKLVVGILDKLENDKDKKIKKIVNSVVVIDESEQVYYKKRLVPMGEETPKVMLFLARILGFPVSAIQPEYSGVAMLNLWGYNLLPILCYESAYPFFLAERNAGGANILLNFSDDGWFGNTEGPEQHLAINRMRAIETNLYNFRITNDGYTALIDNNGNVIKSIPRFILSTLTIKAPMMKSNTIFVKYYFLIVSAIALVALIIAIRKFIIRGR